MQYVVHKEFDNYGHLPYLLHLLYDIHNHEALICLLTPFKASVTEFLKWIINYRFADFKSP